MDQLLSAHEEFLNDLEKMLGPNGTRLVGGIGDVALKHVSSSLCRSDYISVVWKRIDASTGDRARDEDRKSIECTLNTDLSIVPG